MPGTAISFPPGMDALFQMLAQQTEIIKAILPAATAAPQAQATTARVAPGADVNSILLADALKGQDNPTWRVAPGLLLPKFLPERFRIFSILHLIFQQDPVTQEMVKVPKGTALPAYLNFLPAAKLSFPNHVPFRISNPVTAAKAPKELSVDNTAGVRADLERAERIFADLLKVLDNTEVANLPTSKADWLLFIDAGITVMANYSTLANAYAKGGARLSTQYQAMLWSNSKIDFVKLWQPESGEFRKQE